MHLWMHDTVLYPPLDLPLSLSLIIGTGCSNAGILSLFSSLFILYSSKNCSISIHFLRAKFLNSSTAFISSAISFSSTMLWRSSSSKLLMTAAFRTKHSLIGKGYTLSICYLVHIFFKWHLWPALTLFFLTTSFYFLLKGFRITHPSWWIKCRERNSCRFNWL